MCPHGEKGVYRRVPGTHRASGSARRGGLRRANALPGLPPRGCPTGCTPRNVARTVGRRPAGVSGSRTCGGLRPGVRRAQHLTVGLRAGVPRPLLAVVPARWAWMPPTPPRAPDFAVGLRLGGSWGAHSVGPFKRWSRSSSASLPGSAGRAGGRFPARPLRLRPRGGLRFGGPTGLRIWRSVERAGGRFLARPLRLRPRGGVRFGGPTGLGPCGRWNAQVDASWLARPLRLRSRGGVRFGGPTGLRIWRSVECAGGRFLARSPPAAAPARWCAAWRAHGASGLAVGGTRRWTLPGSLAPCGCVRAVVCGLAGPRGFGPGGRWNAQVDASWLAPCCCARAVVCGPAGPPGFGPGGRWNAEVDASWLAPYGCARAVVCGPAGPPGFGPRRRSAARRLVGCAPLRSRPCGGPAGPGPRPGAPPSCIAARLVVAAPPRLPGAPAPSRPYFPGSTCDHAVRPTSSGGCGG